VCAHEALAEIEAALAEGAPYRRLEEIYGVSRSALARHKQHVPLAA